MNATQSIKTTKPQIQIKRVLKHPIEKVWNALTKKEALSIWLMETDDFLLEEGHEFKLTTKPQGNFDGIVHCKILDFTQPETLRYSWKANGMKNPTFVTWKLKELTNNTTHITLSHTGFEGMNGWITKQILKFGWKSLVGKKLNQFLNS